MAARKALRKPKAQKTIGEERIMQLFGMAGSEFKKHPERSAKYVRLARKIAMRYNIKTPRELRGKFCKKCFSYLVQGANSTRRVRGKTLVVTCLKCGNSARHPLGRRK
jgi:ribonuclease P protein subunit RPR2